METKMWEKLDKIEAHLGNQEVHLGKLTVSVEEHIKRTNLLEDQIKPVLSHVHEMRGAIKVLSILATIAAIVEVIILINK